MFLFLLVSAGVTTTVLMLAATAYALMARVADLQTVTVNPFTTVPPSAADTVENLGAVVKTTFVDEVAWKTRITRNLSEAEEILDSLEACGHGDRELATYGNDMFVVRWK